MRSVGFAVHPAHVIDEKDDHVGVFVRCGLDGSKSGQDEGGEKGPGFHEAAEKPRREEEVPSSGQAMPGSLSSKANGSASPIERRPKSGWAGLRR